MGSFNPGGIENELCAIILVVISHSSFFTKNYNGLQVSFEKGIYKYIVK